MNAYDASYESLVAAYISGDADARNDKINDELYTKYTHCLEFFEFCKRYVDIRGLRFLEVGCGTGYVAAAAADKGAAAITATDIVTSAVELAKLRFLHHNIDAELFVSDLREEPAAKHTGAFDFVWCFQVLEHLPRADHFKGIRNLLSYVAPGGFVFIDTENSLCPYDRHDTNTWLIRYLSKVIHDPIFQRAGWGLDFLEPSSGHRVQTRDYLSYDELTGAARVLGFEVIDPYMPHGSKQQYLKTLTKSDWFYDTIGKYIDVERYAPISLLLRKDGK